MKWHHENNRRRMYFWRETTKVANCFVARASTFSIPIQRCFRAGVAYICRSQNIWHGVAILWWRYRQSSITMSEEAQLARRGKCVCLENASSAYYSCVVAHPAKVGI